MAFNKTILITAAGGNIGSQVVPKLLLDNVKLVLITSNADRLRAMLPASATKENVHLAQGNVGDPNFMQETMEQQRVDTVFLVLTGTDELMVTLNTFDAMQHAGTVRHLVYLSASGDYVSDKGFNQIVSSCGAMHVLVKPLLERKLLHTQYPWTTTVLGPTLFFVNDLRSKHSILQGIFDEPLGQAGVSRVSPNDIATVARNALIDQAKWSGKKIMIGTKRRYTGHEIANLWGTAVGRDVKIIASDPEGFKKFERDFEGKMDAAWARDLRLMYETFSSEGFAMTDDDYALQVECLGREPESYEEFVSKTGREWVKK